MTTQATTARVLESSLRPVRAQESKGVFMMDEALNQSTGSYFKEDDRGNYTACILWLMRCRAEIRSGNPYQPMPKPIYPGDNLWGGMPRVNTVNIGIRKRYSLEVLLAIYQFHRAGHNENLIASDTGIPVMTIRKMLEHKTQTQRKAWQLAHQLHIPSKRDIISRLVREV
ncbi:hypothetical protein [Yersinia frederiksenii]|uniref:hypothetical protein n=1 Tax=Yersinia frederiksenii TaxID=29484 RepID=UPI0021BD533B|nr:hypothetical protein [Yersinia frederiksenii]